MLGGALLAVVMGVSGFTYASQSSDDDTPLTGDSLERASGAALDATGGGDVVDSELGDDGASYSVEVRLPDGSQVEVDLDENYVVIGQEVDDDSADATGDDDGQDDD